MSQTKPQEQGKPGTELYRRRKDIGAGECNYVPAKLEVGVEVQRGNYSN